MEFIDNVMNRLAVPEFAELVKNLNVSFEQHGYVDHIPELEPLETQEGIVENQVIVDRVMSIYENNLLKLLTNMYIEVHEETSIYELKDILETVSMLEFSIDSEAITYTYNEDLEPLEQLLEWIEIILPERKRLIEDCVINVCETLITNIFTIHELRVPLEAETVNPLIREKINILKFLHNTFPTVNILAYKLVKEKGFKTFYLAEELYTAFGEDIKSQETKPNFVAMQLMGLATLLDGDCTMHGQVAKQLAEGFFSNPMTVMAIDDSIIKLTSKYGELCTANATTS